MVFNFFNKKPPTGRSLTFKISGMHCTSCALNIDSCLENVEGVISSATNYPKSQTKVTYDPERVKRQEIKKEIEKLGYEANVTSS